MFSHEYVFRDAWNHRWTMRVGEAALRAQLARGPS
jgi:hypothetical protein